MLSLQVLLTCPKGPRGKLFPPESYEQVDQAVGADGTPGRVINIQLVKINLKEGAQIP